MARKRIWRGQIVKVSSDDLRHWTRSATEETQKYNTTLYHQLTNTQGICVMVPSPFTWAFAPVMKRKGLRHDKGKGNMGLYVHRTIMAY